VWFVILTAFITVIVVDPAGGDRASVAQYYAVFLSFGLMIGVFRPPPTAAVLHLLR